MNGPGVASEPGQDDGDDRDELERLADEYLDALRRGERPVLTSFLTRLPGRQGELRELLSALMMVENLKPRHDETMAPAPGQGLATPEILGDFRLIREVGRGGMGVVYEAEQVSLGRRVALKVLSPWLAASPRQTQRFLLEARSAASLHHTNIVPVFGVGEHEGVHYYAMQFISGLGLDKVLEEVRRARGVIGGAGGSPREAATRSAYDALASSAVTRSFLEGRFAGPSVSGTPEPAGWEEGPVSPAMGGATMPGEASIASAADSEQRYARSVARIGVQAAEALDHAHQQGTLHRDIKPSNLLLDRLGNVWVADFGLAKATEPDDRNLTRTGDLVGTLRYLAPERLKGSCDRRSDVHALGLTLYEMLALRPAFDARDRDGLLSQIAERDPPRLRSVEPSIPLDLETIVHKAIDREPSGRYATAGALANDLRCFLEHRPIEARRISQAERLVRWARRNPGLATLTTAVASLLLLIVALVAVANYRLRREHDRALSNLRRAEYAEADAVRRLLEASLSQARAGRRSGLAGRRFEGLRALDETRGLDTGGERRQAFRDEAIACLALADLRQVRHWGGAGDHGPVGVDIHPRTGRIARGTPDGGITIEETEFEAPIIRLPGKGARATLLRFGPDGRYLAARHDPGGAGDLVVWDVPAAREALRVADAVHASALEFLPDGKTLAAGRRDGSIVFYDLEGGRETRRLSPGTVPQTFRFDPAGTRIAVVSPNSDDAVQVRDSALGRPLASWPGPAGALSVAWHPDGRTLAAGGQDGAILILDAMRSGKVLRALDGHNGPVLSVAFHPSGRFLASVSGDGTARLWDAQAGRELLRTAQPDARPIRFTSDGRFLGPGHDGAASWVWEFVDGRECRTLSREGPGARDRHLRVAGLGDGTEGLFLTASDGGFRLDRWPGDASTAFAALPGTLDGQSLPDGSALLTSGASGLRRWPIRRDPAAGRVRVGPPQSLGLLGGHATGRIALAADGKTLAALVDSETGRVALANLERPGDPPLMIGPHPNLERLALSPDARWLATASGRGDGVKVWDATDGRLVRQLPVPGSAEVAFSPDGRRLLTGSGGEYALWDSGTWESRVRFERTGAQGLPGVAAFRGDGSLMAIALGRSEVALVRLGTGEVVARFEPEPSRPIASMAFSAGGRFLALAFLAEAVQVWDLSEIQRGLEPLGLAWESPIAEEVASRWEAGVEPAGWLDPVARSEAAARSGRLAEAIAATEEAFRAGAPAIEIRSRQALYRLASGDLDGYRATCRALVSGVQRLELPLALANNLAWACAIGPEAVEDHGPLIAFAEAAARARPETNRLNTLGAILFRAGRYRDAIEQLDRAVQAHGAGGTPYDALFLAMAHHRLGRPEAAREWLGRAREPAPIAMSKPDVAGPSSWIPRLELALLRREAEGLILPGGPAPAPRP